MSLITQQMNTDDLLQALIQVKTVMKDWGWSVASVGDGFTAIIYQNGVFAIGPQVQYAYVPQATAHFGTMPESLVWCMNSLMEKKREIDTLHEMQTNTKLGSTG